MQVLWLCACVCVCLVLSCGPHPVGIALIGLQWPASSAGVPDFCGQLLIGCACPKQ